jgi:UrcA family protein
MDTNRRVAPMLVALALTLGGAFASATWASGWSDAPSITVPYGDLDLSTKQGVETLHRRIKSAAKQVCGDGFEPGDIARASVYRQCVRTAANKALEKVQLAEAQVQWVVK